jgi:hypothetical protein
MAALKWNLLQRRFRLVASEAATLQTGSEQICGTAGAVEIKRETCQIGQEGQKVGILKRLTAFPIRFEKSFSTGGWKPLAPKYHDIYHTSYNV